MPSFRFSIARVLVCVVLIALALASAIYPTETWSSVIYSATLGILAAAILGALFRRGPARAFWAGLAIVGWGYLNFSLNLSLYDYVNQYPYARDIRPQLVTTRLLEYLYEHATSVTPRRVGQTVYVIGWMQPDRRQAAVFEEEKDGLFRVSFTAQGPGAGQWVKPSQVRLAEPRLYQFTGHSLLSLFFGWLAGLLARSFARRQEREQAAQARAEPVSAPTAPA